MGTHKMWNRSTTKKGFTLIEIVIVVSIIAIIVVIGIPGLLRTRVNANHAMIEGDLRTFSSSIEMYRSQQNPPAYSPNIAALTGANPPFLDTTWDTANAVPGKHSYTFAYAVVANGATYSMLAAPIGVNGVNTYCIDQTGVLVGGNGGTAPTGDDTGCVGGVAIS